MSNDREGAMAWPKMTAEQVIGLMPLEVQGHIRDVEGLRVLLAESYGDPGRHYHDLGHLWDLVLRLNHTPYDGAYKVELYVAILYHDIVYDVEKKDNEHRSALVARESGSRYFRDVNWDVVVRCIEATVHQGLGAGASLEEQILCDLDLAGLLLGAKERAEDMADIREEYRVYSDEEFRVGRIAFFDMMLEKERIFYTLGPRADVVVRENMRRDRAVLDARGKLDAVVNG